jgi:lysozyme
MKARSGIRDRVVLRAAIRDSFRVPPDAVDDIKDIRENNASDRVRINMNTNVVIQRRPASACFFSQTGMDLLEQAESLSLQPYDDQTGKPTGDWVPGATIGYGHLITQNEWSTYAAGFGKADAESLLAHDLAPCVAAVRTVITAPVSQNEFDAMVMLTFNIGVTAFTTSTVSKLVNNPNAASPYPSLEAAWKAWDRSQGKVMTGLDKRRQCEWNVYANELYQSW